MEVLGDLQVEKWQDFSWIALRDGEILPSGGTGNFAGWDFFICWWESDEEWFSPLKRFSVLKTTFCKYWTSIKIKISMSYMHEVWSWKILLSKNKNGGEVMTTAEN